MDETTGAAQDVKAERKAAKLAQRINAFAKEHGGTEGHVEYIGSAAPGSSSSARTAAGATWWRRPHAIAEEAVKKAGITVHETFDGEFAAKVRPGRTSGRGWRESSWGAE